PMTSVSSGSGREVRSDVYYYTNQIVNVVMIGEPGSSGWVLIDAGMPKCGPEILAEAESRFGKDRRPSAIILTHGHFDHVGGLVYLIEAWNVPIYAHPLEFPYLTGEKSYPEPDTSVEGGLLAKISSIYPIEPIDVSEAIKPLPEDGHVPGLPQWRWFHVPGHSPGQVALFRERDRTLLSADAFVTVKQDAFYKVLIQKEEICGPPVYLTTDWHAAKESVKKLQALQPELVVSGHGTAMKGAALNEGLKNLAENFDKEAVPSHGKYVD